MHLQNRWPFQKRILIYKNALTCTVDYWSLCSWSWLQTWDPHAQQTRSFDGWERANSYEKNTVKAKQIQRYQQPHLHKCYIMTFWWNATSLHLLSMSQLTCLCF